MFNLFNKENLSIKKLIICAIGVTVLLVAVVIISVVLIVNSHKQESALHIADNSETINSVTASEQPADEVATSESAKTVKQSNSLGMSTGHLSETGNGYEGTKGTGKYNYGEALQKSLLFFELQRSGDLPNETRCNWRGDSALSDGSDNGIDLTGGLYDAGDHVKFNLPMAYSASVLGWSVIEDEAAYEESKQLPYALDGVRYINDYLIKCHPDDETYYYQVGNGGTDHSWWGPAEVMHMERPSYFVTKVSPGSTPVAEAAASLAVASIVFREEDPDYSKKCLEHAKSLFTFAETTKSDTGYTMASGFYDSHSGFYDELSWSSVWLYKATGDNAYLNKAETYYKSACQDYNWALCWDDVHIGAAVLLAQITKKEEYKDAVEYHLDYWSTGTSDGKRITYSPKGLAWLDNWGSLRYATTTAFVAAVYSTYEECPKDKASVYWDFALAQAGYALGDTGFSYVIGFGENYPQHPHHRTSQGSYCNNMNEPAESKHTLYGALVGGPDAKDNYTDTVSNFNTNEVACDYNAGFTGLMAKMYSKYHGQTLVDFGAVEPITDQEMYVLAAINVEGDDFIEIRAFICNESAWPARKPTNLVMKCFVDLSECIEAGQSAEDIEITTNYTQGGTVEGLKVWDEEKNIYSLDVNFSNIDLYPGGQDCYKKEIQIRMRNTKGTWDSTNDPSLEGLNKQEAGLATQFGLYENDELIFGSQPQSGNNVGKGVSQGTQGSKDAVTKDSPGTNTQQLQKQTASGDNLSVEINYSGMTGQTSGISPTMTITNNGSDDIDVSDLEIRYYFTDSGNQKLDFSCYHAAVNDKSGSYSALSKVSGEYKDFTGTNADTVLSITFDDSIKLKTGGTMVVNFCINRSDWSMMDTTDDYSVQKVENIVILYNSKIIFGTEP